MLQEMLRDYRTIPSARLLGDTASNGLNGKTIDRSSTCIHIDNIKAKVTHLQE